MIDGMTSSDPVDLPHVDGMRRRSRVVLVALTWAVLLGASAALVFPGLDAGIFTVNPLAVVLIVVWFVLMVALLLQVSHRWHPVVLGLCFLALVAAPGFVYLGVVAGYGPLGSERTSATVVEAHPRGNQPPSVLFELEDGTRERGYSTGMTDGPYPGYVVPRAGSRVAVLRDDAGLLPPRLAVGDTSTDSTGRALAALVPGALGLLVLGVATVSVLTRRESFVTRTARESEARRLADLHPGTTGQRRRRSA